VASTPACPRELRAVSAGSKGELFYWFDHARGVSSEDSLAISYFPTAVFGVY
jgi:hypothetical protein